MAKSPTNSKATTEHPNPEEGTVVSPGRTKRRRVIYLAGGGAGVVLLLGVGLWFTGSLPHLFGRHHQTLLTGPVYVKVPEIVANLNVPSGQDSYAKLEATLEFADGTSTRAVMNDMPRIIDVFQTYLRAMRPDELRGASGTYRLREALINRVRIAAAPNVVKDVLFEELIVQ